MVYLYRLGFLIIRLIGSRRDFPSEGSDRSSFDSYFFPVHDPLVHVEHRRMTVFVHLL
jgi:hypothetical protein